MKNSRISIRKFSFFGILFLLQLRNNLLISNYATQISKYQNIFIAIAILLLAMGWNIHNAFSGNWLIRIIALTFAAAVALAFNRELVAPSLIVLFFAAEMVSDCGINYIIKCYLISSVSIGSFIFISAKIGIIAEGVVNSRFCGGFKGPNAFGFIVFMIIIGFHYFAQRLNKFVAVIIDCMLFLLCFQYCGSRTALISSVVFIVLCFVDGYICGIERIINGTRIVNKYFKHSFFINTVISYVWAKNYTLTSSLKNINLMLSYRPFYWNKYVNWYPFSIFGLGSDKTALGPLDNAYLAVTVFYGFFGLIIYASIFSFVAQKILSENNKFLMVAYIAFIVYMFSEATPISPIYNFLILYAFSSFWRKIKMNHKYPKQFSKNTPPFGTKYI